MAYARWLAFEVLEVARANRFWMTWNLVLACVPAFLAVVLFGAPHRRSVVWWSGAVVFVLFLPNAPYVITDLIHLRADVARAPSDGVVVFGVLPIYAAFVAVGFGCFLVCLELIVRELQSVRSGLPRWAIELVTCGVCAVGIALGRLARLNSWDTVQNPRWAAEATFNTLTWRGAPFAIGAIFVAVVLTTFALRAVLAALVAAAARTGARVRPVLGLSA